MSNPYPHTCPYKCATDEGLPCQCEPIPSAYTTQPKGQPVDELRETLRAEKLYEELLPKAKELGVDVKYIEWLIYTFLPAQRQALRDEVEKAVQSLVVNDLEAVRANNKHLDSTLYEHTVSEASGYIKAVKDATKAISTIFEGKEQPNE